MKDKQLCSKNTFHNHAVTPSVTFVIDNIPDNIKQSPAYHSDRFMTVSKVYNDRVNVESRASA